MTSALGVCATPYIDPIENGKFKVDLKGINAMRLERAGLLRSTSPCPRLHRLPP